MPTHTRFAVQVVATGCATALVIASAGFGAVYAYRVGIEHSFVLASLTVLFAIALEGIKPLAIAQAFQLFASWAPIRGIALAGLGVVAVAYSVTSELALMSASRGDLAAERLKASETGNIARDRYANAKAELVRLAPSRTVLEIEALIDTIKPICRMVRGESVCSKPVPLIAELARAKRRQELEASLREAGAQVANGSAVAVADPGASALVTYLSALGISVSADLLAQWLNLVPVLALELGSALAGVLATSVSHERVTAVQPVPLLLPSPQAAERDRVSQGIVRQLQANGGSIRGTHRSLAQTLDADRNTVSRALNSLAASGVIAVATSRRHGSLLRLLM
jgi:hypothetical protein